MNACSKCGCTEKRACLEFDAEGYAHACHWALPDVCSACFFSHAPPYFETDTRLVVKTKRFVAGGRRSTKRRFIRAPELAGMVARHRWFSKRLQQVLR